MKRRHVISVGALVIMVVVAALDSQQRRRLLILEWVGKAAAETPPRAIPIELGLKDAKPLPWSGRAVVRGATVSHREGYRFRAKDKLIQPDGWQASSHRPIRLPKGNPALLKMMGMDTVGVVLHLTNIMPDATLTLHRAGSVSDGSEREPPVVHLKEVLAGKSPTVWQGRARVRLISTATPVVTDKTEDDFPAAAYGPDGTLWVAYISYTVKEESRRIEAPDLKEQPPNFKAYNTPEFGDQVFVKYYKDGKWSKPIAITGPNEDIVRCAVAAEGNGTVWVVYSAHREGNHRLYARPISTKDHRLGQEQLLPAQFGFCRNLNPVACTDQKGSVWIALQRWREGNAWISTYSRRGDEWYRTQVDFGVGRTSWQPAIAADLHGEIVPLLLCSRPTSQRRTGVGVADVD